LSNDSGVEDPISIIVQNYGKNGLFEIIRK
jgi:hypothetical protein